MPEERGLYTVGNADSVPDALTPEAAIVTLSGQVADLERRMKIFAAETANRFETSELSARIDRLQDAHLAPVLEGIAVLVELRRIADVLENQSVTLATVGEWVVGRFDNGVLPKSSQPCDCDELSAYRRWWALEQKRLDLLGGVGVFSHDDLVAWKALKAQIEAKS